MFYDIGDLHADQMRWIHKVEPKLQAGDMLLGGTIFTNILTLFFGKFLGNGIQLPGDAVLTQDILNDKIF